VSQPDGPAERSAGPLDSAGDDLSERIVA